MKRPTSVHSSENRMLSCLSIIQMVYIVKKIKIETATRFFHLGHGIPCCNTGLHRSQCRFVH